MNKEEFTSKREQMMSVKRNAIIAVSKVVRLFTNADIKDFIITGSQELIIQGFMFHRNGDKDSRTSILVHERIGVNGEVKLEPIKLSSGQVSELRFFDEYEELK